ncbi:hypothetical protein HPP92_021944 [Vanilla planifolia]|uniref:Exostosin GT47 domain-containing protein n=1 Tax=Vanilla planifolia TaxID=51239 RepID=A0A835UGS4_VANPL|nr:hypothetical protein HPP92_021944 [Vanilla planifolia]
MSPRLVSPPLETHLFKRLWFTTPFSSPDHRSKSNAFQSLHISTYRRAFVICTILSLQVVILFSAHSIPAAWFNFSLNATAAAPAFVADAPAPGPNSCESGLVYIYDLPSMFNKELIKDCSGFNPWASRCDAIANGGFGIPAADLVGIVPDSLISSWHSTDQFAAELIYHRRMLTHRCRTTDPSVASAFYIPFYAGLAVGRHLWSSNSTSDERDRTCVDLLRWMDTQAPWRKLGGLDHFITLGRITWDFRRSHDRDWGGSFLYMPGMANVTRLVIERDPWDDRDVGIPYPTGFHPRSAAEARAWQGFVRSQIRSTLFSFAGAARAGFKNDFRGLLLAECSSAGDACRTVDCSGGRCGNRSAETMSLFLDSVFCLQPRGDSFTRSAYEQYSWYLPGGEGDPKAEEWSVFIDRRELRNGSVTVRGILEGIGADRIRSMRERVINAIPKLVYAGAEEGLGEGMEDAFDVAVRGVLSRFRDRRRR